MDGLAAFLTYPLGFAVVLTVVVFVHELGHYWVARRCGVRVEVFSIGFGPELIGRTDKRGTRWKLSAIPFGGYVKMFGRCRRRQHARRRGRRDERGRTPRRLSSQAVGAAGGNRRCPGQLRTSCMPSSRLHSSMSPSVSR